jgi:hypothetical protein
MKSKQTKRRVIALVFVLCFIVLSLLSEAYILTHADAGHQHDHNGAGGACTVCVTIHNAENLLKLTAAVLCAAFLLVNLTVATSVLCTAFTRFGLQSPVKMKIRMNN